MLDKLDIDKKVLFAKFVKLIDEWSLILHFDVTLCRNFLSGALFSMIPVQKALLRECMPYQHYPGVNLKVIQ